MRKTIEPQMRLGEVDISQIQFDLRSRDEIPKLLMGLHHIYCTRELREEVFRILEEMVGKKVDIHNGRPGMELWKILVLGTIRLNCDWDYDKLKEMADNHITLRKMLGHNLYNEANKYALQTLKDNVSLLTPEVLKKINEVVVKAGHTLVKKKDGDDLKGRYDSFVVETNVHFPTDINLLFDAIRKVIILTARICHEMGIPGWRQSRHNLKKIRKHFHKARKLRRSNAKDPEKRAKREEVIARAYKLYLEIVASYFKRVEDTIARIREEGGMWEEMKVVEIEHYMKHAERQIEQIDRRVLQKEAIPHEEKVFSIFETHTEWICKGKAGVPQELGVGVGIIEDKYGFILDHRVMWKQIDKEVVVPMVRETQGKYADLRSCSFDKGCYTPENRRLLEEHLERVIMPKKGRLSEQDKEREYAEEFVKSRQKHPAVESGINALENHGLDRCPDRGTRGFARYVGLAIVARNLQKVGDIIQRAEIKKQERLKKLRQTREKKKLLCAA